MKFSLFFRKFSRYMRLTVGMGLFLDSKICWTRSRASSERNRKARIIQPSTRRGFGLVSAGNRGIYHVRQTPYCVQFTRWLSIFIVMLSARGHGQETNRMSLASEQAAIARNPVVGSNYYNVHTGPVYFRFQGEMGIEFNDNINFTESDRRADVILRPILNTDLLWPLTERNSLSFFLAWGTCITFARALSIIPT